VCGTRQPRRQSGIGLLRGVRLGHAREEEDDDDADKRARGGSDTERGEKGEAASASADWAGPLCGARVRKSSELAGLMDGRLRRSSGPAAWGARAECRGGSSRPSGQKLRKEKISIFFFFSNISNAFSNNF
jgi:hypothetical protein